MYDLYLFALTLKQIQTDLAIPEASLGVLGSLVRLGAFPACIVALMADRVGRRTVLLGTILAYTLLTGVTACAPNAQTFVLLQFGARTFAVAETLLAVVVIAEEFDPDVRGWGIGAVGAIQACGAGFAALLFMGVEVLPFGWRSLYLVGLGPLLLLAAWRRTLPETTHFIAHQTTRGSTTSALQPLRALVRMYPGRLGAIAATVFILELAEAPASFFGPKYLQDVHGWTPTALGILTIAGGALAIVGNVVAGWGSDRWGRRRVALVFILGQVVWTLAYYSVSGPLLVVAWIGRIFMALGANVTLSAFGVELFPTSYRSTAAGIRLVCVTLGGSLGLLLESLLYGVVASHWVTIGALATLALPGAWLVARWFPETAGRTLDDIAPERA
jgi:putative MFS transporter